MTLKLYAWLTLAAVLDAAFSMNVFAPEKLMFFKFPFPLLLAPALAVGLLGGHIGVVHRVECDRAAVDGNAARPGPGRDRGRGCAELVNAAGVRDGVAGSGHRRQRVGRQHPATLDPGDVAGRPGPTAHGHAAGIENAAATDQQLIGNASDGRPHGDRAHVGHHRTAQQAVAINAQVLAGPLAGTIGTRSNGDVIIADIPNRRGCAAANGNIIIGAEEIDALGCEQPAPIGDDNSVADAGRIPTQCRPDIDIADICNDRAAIDSVAVHPDQITGAAAVVAQADFSAAHIPSRTGAAGATARNDHLIAVGASRATDDVIPRREKLAAIGQNQNITGGRRAAAD